MEESRRDEDNNLILKLGNDDSALVVRVDGTVELFSSEFNDHQDGYLGDVEDLNKTFSLVLALAASLEDKDLYDRIFHNLNRVLMNQWENLDDDKKKDIVKIRKQKEEERSDIEKKEKEKRVDGFRERMSKHRRGYYDDQQKRMIDDLFREQEFMKKHEADFGKSRPKKMKSKMKSKKKPSLKYLKDINWDPYDKTLSAHFKDFRADLDPDEEK